MGRFFQQEKIKDIMVIRFTGIAVTLSNSVDLKQEIDRLLAQGDKYFIADLENVKYATSLFVAIMVYFLKSVKDRNGLLKLCCINKTVLGAFQVARMEDIFDISPSTEDAVTALTAKM